jgi:hypothetical protein
VFRGEEGGSYAVLGALCDWNDQSERNASCFPTFSKTSAAENGVPNAWFLAEAWRKLGPQPPGPPKLFKLDV